MPKQNRLRYIWSKWFHHDLTEPTDLYYEIQEDGWALRAVEVFADGSTEKFDGRFIEGPIPPIEEINAIPEFEAMEISKAEFENLWEKAIERL